MIKLYQLYYFITSSLWLMVCSMNFLGLILGLIVWFYLSLLNLLILSFIILLMISFQWWRDLVRESFNQGNFSSMILENVKLGMILFIISELFFFLSFFWSYCHMFLSLSIDIGSVWLLKGIVMFNLFFILLVNTIILLTSGVTITLSHFYLINNNLKLSIDFMGLTIFLGLFFTSIQIKEYYDSNYCISDSSFGSIFFISTGFHGLHVIIGSLFLLVNLYRMIKFNYSMYIHMGFELSAWYWHFVDVIWLFLYLLIYYWSY